ncbi:hypothetical protein HPP92_017519 [Vanilla planifolia]|uniref:Uncharacterized protein n=1 Tax=Vanilla planifolia TaxID=51239 RepID=A0A835UQN0_VANPL|nr:hypothetical protein HPP92_017519 [Vanilla planifolia]
MWRAHANSNLVFFGSNTMLWHHNLENCSRFIIVCFQFCIIGDAGSQGYLPNEFTGRAVLGRRIS